jgi:hypothetical protein
LIESWAQSRDEDRRDTEQARRRAAGAVVADDGVAGQASAAGAGARCANGLVKAVRQAFSDYGFDADQAELRANTTFAAGLGLLHLSGPTPRNSCFGPYQNVW